jgi:hypothetical protein
MIKKTKDWVIFHTDKKMLQIERKLFHLRLRFCKNKRPSSYPYLAGDSFRALAQHIHDETGTFEPSAVKKNDIVFVGQSYLFHYFTDIHPKVSERYVLICHNGDYPQIDENIFPYIDEKIIHFFAQDVITEHPKVTPIPIGLENKYRHTVGMTNHFDYFRGKIKKSPPRRKNRIFYSFNPATNPTERVPAKEYFSKHPLMDTPERFLSSRQHNQQVTTYKFVASPPGNSIESNRTWESLYLQTIPIVKNYASYRYFVSLGLPMWIVNDWQELEGLTEGMLAARYQEMIAGASWEAMHMDFWIKKIQQTINGL